MCRPKQNGGRRCPSHSNPVLVAERNSRRREAYARKKQAQTRQGLTETIITNDHAENNYFTRIQNSGQITDQDITPELYKRFGFSDITESRQSPYDLTRIYTESKEEIKHLTPSELLALKTFTTNEYKWINNSLYNWLEEDEGLREEIEPHTPVFTDENATRYMTPPAFRQGDHTPSLLKELTQKMDEGLAKAPQQQRIVYRGLRQRARVLQADGGPEEFINKNCQVGAELSFDGYQSTSYDPYSASAFARENGIIFEIKTSSGLNLSSESAYPAEQEVLLPRGAKYIVVGSHKNIQYKTVPEDVRGEGVENIRTLHVIQLVEVRENKTIGTHQNRPSAPPALTPEQLRTVEANPEDYEPLPE